MKRILPFLLLNVAVSAITMLLVLVLWQAAHPMPKAPLTALTPVSSASQPTAAAASYNDSKIEILTVIGAGDLEFEVVTLKNTGKNPVDLTGWTLRDAKGDSFTFPAFTVFPNGAFQVFSKSGTNTSLELYWSSAAPLWKSGDEVFLYDPSGEKRQEFSIP